MAEQSLCKIDGCGKPVMARGWCTTHYNALREMPVCSIEGCGQRSRTKGLCQSHYLRLLRHGSPEGGTHHQPKNVPCSVDICGRPVKHNGFCNAHYQRCRNHGDALGGNHYADNSGVCSVDGCETSAHVRGYCRNHYERWKRYGDPTAGNTSKGEPEGWLRDHVAHADESTCLIWPFSHHGSRRGTEGYGRLKIGRKYIYAHRMMCALSQGAAPTPNHEAAHSCGNGHMGCVNPHHLRWDTTQGNADDRRVHGTENKGSRNGQAVLTETDVRQIKALLGKISQRALADKFGVSRWAITDIALGRRWGWLE